MNLNTKIEMFVVDLDGTLLNNEKIVGKKDLQTLHTLKQLGICRTVATGRSPKSLHTVLADDFPVDYVVFSSGAGIMDWKTKKLLKTHSLSNRQIINISGLLREINIGFSIHNPIPDNHIFYYYKNGTMNRDFEFLFNLYPETARYAVREPHEITEATQFLAMAEQNDELIEYLRTHKNLNDVKVIRASSPIDGVHMWIEFFPKAVSKGEGVNWLCEQFGFNPKATVSLGNDYNDLDMLDFTTHSFVVSNAPESLKEKYQVTCSNQENPLTEVLGKFL